MPNKPAAVQSFALSEPTADEIALAYNSHTRAVVGRNLGTPTDETAARIADVYGQPIDPSRLFVVPIEASNSLPDSYATYMSRGTLARYAEHGREGRALMLNHRHLVLDLPIGHTYDGRVVDDVDATTGAAKMFEDEPISRAIIDGYIVRDIHLGHISNNDAIAAIETRTLRDASVGFHAEDYVCKLCGQSTLTTRCTHIPGLKYADASGNMRRAWVRVDDGALLELSFGWEGSTPEAGVIAVPPSDMALVSVKSRMIAAQGKLTSTEADQLVGLQRRTGVRIIDPSHLRSAGGFHDFVNVATRAPAPSAPALPQPAGNATTGEANRQSGKETAVTVKPNNAAPRIRVGLRAPADAPPADAASAAAQPSGDLEQTVSTGATDQAQALADRIDALTQRIAAKTAEHDACQAELDALSNDPNATPDAAQYKQDQLAALEAEIQADTDELAAAQAELDAVNGVAADTGGQPAQPAADAAAQPTDPNSPAARMVNAMKQASAAISKNVMPVYASVRISDEQAAIILQLGKSLVEQLQMLLENSGEQPVRATGDRLAIAALMRIANLNRFGLVEARRIAQDAEIGRRYRQRLEDDIIAERTRGLMFEGDPRAAERYRAGFRSWNIEQLEDDYTRAKSVADGTWTHGRNVMPNNRLPLPPTPEDADADDAAEAEPNMFAAGGPGITRHPQTPARRNPPRR